MPGSATLTTGFLHAQNMEDVDECIRNLQNSSMMLKVKDDIAGFLGMHIDQQDDEQST
jgi:hypothetical protein